MDAYTIANLRTGVRWDGFDVSVYVHNVFDDDGVIRALRRPLHDPLA